MQLYINKQHRSDLGVGKIIIGTLATGLTALLLIVTYQAAQTDTPGRSRAAPQTAMTVSEWGFDDESKDWNYSGLTGKYELGNIKLFRNSEFGISTLNTESTHILPEGNKYIQLKLAATSPMSGKNSSKSFGKLDTGAVQNSKNIVVRYQIASKAGWQPPLLLRVYIDGGMRLYELKLPQTEIVELQKLQFDFSDLSQSGTVTIDAIKILVDQKK